MDKNIVNSLGFNVPVGFYSSYDEADQAAGKQNACLDECNRNLYYRGAAPEVREIIAATVVVLTGIPRETKTVMKSEKDAEGNVVQSPALDDDGNEITEFVDTEATYVKKALAASGKTVEQLQAEVEKAVANANDGKGVSVDIKRAERQPAKPKTLPAKYKEIAEKSIASGKVERFSKDYAKLMGKDLDAQDGDGVWNVEKVGFALKEFVAAKEAQQLQALAA